MKQSIGVIGATGDLGSQLVQRLKDSGFTVLTHSRSNPGATSINELMEQCSIVHVCSPLTALEGAHTANAVVVLHDSVMNSSRVASQRFLDGKAAITHMLMNKTNTIVVAVDASHHDMLAEHARLIGLQPKSMTVDEHDYLIARSQAPLALLCETLLPYLYEQDDRGLLTPSGELLTDTLRSRELIWTEETRDSILRNPELQPLINDMQLVIERHKGI